MKSTLNRRKFLKHSALAYASVLIAPHLRARAAEANGKLNIGVIGVANQGMYNLTNVGGQNIVALCDVDEKFLGAAVQKFPGAKTYADFRRLIDQKGIDAIVVATPDHTHAVAAVAALKSGRDLYCEKPLARTISEARIITETARNEKRVTQIGTQIHAGGNYRRVVELVQSGAIGKVKDVHVWVNSSYGGMERPQDTPPVPAQLNYDLWLGPVEPRPYHPDHVPFKWRHWWAFGGGSLADFGCHFMDLPHWALGLSHCTSVEILDGPKVHPESTPPWLIARYQYPQRGPFLPVTLTWYHGGKQPSLLTPEQAMKWKSGVLFIGDKGMLYSNYDSHQLLPEKDFAEFVRPTPFIPDSIGHHAEWIAACKNRSKTTCGFDYSGPLTETVLLGNAAFRTGRKLEWDSKTLTAKNCPEADEFIRHRYRPGWML
jgi:predicted dehydrogenase